MKNREKKERIQRRAGAGTEGQTRGEKQGRVGRGARRRGRGHESDRLRPGELGAAIHPEGGGGRRGHEGGNEG